MLNGCGENNYNNFMSYYNSFLQGNNNISNILNISDLILKYLLQCIDYNMVLNNKSNIKSYIRSYKNEITKQSGILEDEVNNILIYIKEQKENMDYENKGEIKKSLSTKMFGKKGFSFDDIVKIVETVKK